MNPRKILVVDDDPEMRLALSIRLRANGFEVCIAVDGVSAIAEARKHLPDLMLLDLGLPAGDGFTVLERLSAMPALSQIPVIVVSGRNRVANQKLAIAAGARAFLQKPVKNSDLLAEIEKILGPRMMPAPEAIVYDLGHRLPTAR